MSQTRVADQTGGSFENQGAPSTVTAKDIAVSLSNEALTSVHAMVGQLKRMSTAIKRASMTVYDIRVARDRDSKNDPDQSADHEKLARNIVQYKFQVGSGSVPESLVNEQQALVNGVEFRMRRFADWKRHHKRRMSRERKMVRVQASMMEQPFTGEYESQGVYEPVPQTGDLCGKESTEKGNQGQSTVLSGQSFESKLFEQPSSVSHLTNMSASVRSVMGSTFIDWPRPPRMADATSRTEKVECPYCYDQLEISEECQQYLKMFSSEEQWVKHIRTYHSRGIWICRLEPHKQAESFTEQSTVRQHLEVHHKGMFPKSRIETLLKSMHRLDETNLFEECPLNCLDQPSAAESDRLTQHVANHLLSLAMDSLPERSVASSQSSFLMKDKDQSESSSITQTNATVQEGLNELPRLDFESHEDIELASTTHEMKSIIDEAKGLNTRQDITTWLESLEQEAEVIKTSSFPGRPDYWKILYLVLSFRVRVRTFQARQALSRLSEAASRGDNFTVQTLLEKGVLIDLRGRDGEPALIHAIKNGQAETVKLLLESGADPDIKGKLGDAALVHAARNSNKAIVDMLCSYDADVDENGRRALEAAAMNKDEETVQLLLKNGARFKAADWRLQMIKEASANTSEESSNLTPLHKTVIGQADVYSSMYPSSTVSPEASFISSSAASRVITKDYDSHAETWYEQHVTRPSRETAIVSQEALTIVNNFLDQLLFSFLSSAQALTPSALRQAVTEVLNPKLAKYFINYADERLREHIRDVDEKDYTQRRQGVNDSQEWDLELVWKLTRLRCMASSSLGDMKEEDENIYVEKLAISYDVQVQTIISPAAIIFMTSVIEYMGEFMLIAASQATYYGLHAKPHTNIKESSDTLTKVDEGSRGHLKGPGKKKRGFGPRQPFIKKLCCLFFKLDPRKYQCCAGYDLTNWDRVLQHLKRMHIIRRDHCPKCRKEFGGEFAEAEKNEHVRQDICAEKTALGTGLLLQDEYDDLNGLPGTHEEKWFKAWEKLFGEHPVPHSPFFETVDCILGVQHSTLERELPTILQSFRRDTLARPEGDTTSATMDAILRLLRNPIPTSNSLIHEEAQAVLAPSAPTQTPWLPDIPPSHDSEPWPDTVEPLRPSTGDVYDQPSIQTMEARPFGSQDMSNEVLWRQPLVELDVFADADEIFRQWMNSPDDGHYFEDLENSGHTIE
ncbi:hypothetical protein FPRO05_10814 [Fusarium proliferatum]|uniref:Uncharacterized protein n=1 Tax=Gibberella intermedia TaxID=948311 RepID=A0A365NCH2_GIBIN|nr:hypothetical protein FPRO05_10814 [Fusarium proliferatum]